MSGRLGRCHYLGLCWALLDLLPFDKLVAIVNLDPAAFPFSHCHLAVSRSILTARRPDLQQATFVADHPIIADGACLFQPEHSVQIKAFRNGRVIILNCLRLVREAAIVVRQIRAQKPISFRYRSGLLQPHFLNQPVLMNAVVAFHASFGLWRTRGNDADAQLRAHTSKLRQRGLPAQFLFCRRLLHLARSSTSNRPVCRPTVSQKSVEYGRGQYQ